MTLKLKKCAAAVTLLCFSGVAAGFSCPPVIDSIWQAGMNASQSTVEAAIAAMNQTISTTRANNLMRVQNALKVMTKQIDSTTSKEMATTLAARQASANLAVELSNRKQTFNTMMDYNAATGQGFDPCGELVRSQNIAVSIGEANTSMSEKVIRELDAGPGKLTSDRAAMIAARMSQARTTYCSADEAKMGLCSSAGDLAGKDVSAAHFFSSARVGSAENNAKNAMLNHMFGTPHQALSKAQVLTPDGKAFLEAKRNEDAVRSVSQASMKSIQSWTESRGVPGSSSDSVLDSIAKKVNTYSGGEGYDDWEKSKTAQSERGLLVEYAKMAAQELYMLHMEYQQTERMEAAIATLQAVKARGAMQASAPVGDSGASKVKQ